MTAMEYFQTYKDGIIQEKAGSIEEMIHATIKETIEIIKEKNVNCIESLISIVQDQNTKLNDLALMLAKEANQIILPWDWFINSIGKLELMTMLYLATHNSEGNDEL